MRRKRWIRFARSGAARTGTSAKFLIFSVFVSVIIQIWSASCCRLTGRVIHCARITQCTVISTPIRMSSFFFEMAPAHAGQKDTAMIEGKAHVESLDAEHELSVEDPSGIELPAAQTSSARRLTLNMGPQHPSTHGVLRVVLELDGETILKARPEIGYLHTGIEKQCEGRKYQQVVPLTDRTDYLSNLNNNLCYALAVERLLKLEIPPMAQWMRVLLCELQRVSSHLVWLGTHALDIGAMSVYFYCMREREEILKIFEMFSGQRMMTSYIRPGGLALEPPRGWHKAISAVLPRLRTGIDEYQNLLSSNPIWVNRTKGVGAFPVDKLIELGVTGPMLRAAGVKMDARKDCPHSSYELFEFD